MTVGGGTAVGSAIIIASSVGVDTVSFGTTLIPSTGAKVIGATGVIVGSNKFISGISQIFNGVYGREVKKGLNPIKDTLIYVNPSGEYRDFYNALEVVTEVGVGQLAPYAIGVNRNNINNKTIYENRNYLSGSKNLQLNQPKNPEYQKVRNDITLIDNIEFSGHALDRMQDRGIPISVVKETIQYGVKMKSKNNRIKYYDLKNNVQLLLKIIMGG